MKMIALAAVAALAAGQASANAVTISDCAYETSDFAPVPEFIDCTVTNISERAISEIHYALKVTEEGREAPWISERDGVLGDQPTPLEIPGGLEPGESAI